MAKVEIITRCFNRLEYTMMCVRGIHEKVGDVSYSHTLVDQNSTDGTGDWIKSIVKEGFYNIKPVYNDTNTGDAGGMKDGFDVIDDDCEYVMQFDNDCEPITNGFLKKLVDIMDADGTIGAIMMKRDGVGTHLVPKSSYTTLGVELGVIPKGTCCIIFRRDTLSKLNIWAYKDQIGWGFKVSGAIRGLKLKVLKALNLRVNHIDGPNDQLKRYPYYFKSVKGRYTNYKVLDYLD